MSLFFDLDLALRFNPDSERDLKVFLVAIKATEMRQQQADKVQVQGRVRFFFKYIFHTC